MPRQSRSQVSGHTILVVDDQEETLSSVRRLLEREGHTVLTAESGDRALELFKANDVHLMLVDYFMPRMTGEELVREIRTFDPHVQIILQTGYSGEKPPRTMLAELDIQGYHDKAEGPEQLLLWVEVGLKAHRLIYGLRERDRLQAELVANVSHEFRVPLAVISGYAELLLGDGFGKLAPDATAPLEAIDKAVTSLTNLVSDFLNYAKLEAKALTTTRQPVTLGEVTAELGQLSTTLLQGRPVCFQVEQCAAIEVVHSDPVKLRTILRNLVTNAIKFTSEGSITLRVAAENGSVYFSVEDTGPGIARDAQEIIFEPFRQLNGSMTRVHGGIGLGLALCRKLAQLLGGTLDVHSEPGAGAIFTLAIPDAPALQPLADEVRGAAARCLRARPEVAVAA